MTVITFDAFDLSDIRYLRLGATIAGFDVVET